MERDYKLLLIIGVLVFAVLIIGLVLADIISTPTTEFNFNQSISNYYNITINKSGTALNFTWINITLPTGFTFQNGTNETNSTHSPTFFNITNASGNVVLIWNSTAGVMNTIDISANFAFNATSPNPGNFTIHIATLDNATTPTANTTNISVFINDTIAPNVSVAYPSDRGNYSLTSINFNITVLDNYKLAPNGICWYTLNDFTTNNTMTNTTTAPTVWNATNTSIADGNYVAKFWCNDTANNVNNSELVNFTIDTTNPEMSITYPVNNTNYSSATQDLNYTFSETYPGFCWYSNNSGVANSSTVVMGVNWTDLKAAEGDDNWTLYCNDTLNNLNSTIIFFTIDTTAPSVSYSCSPTIVSHGGKVTCSCSTTDAGSGVETSSAEDPNTQAYGTQTISCSATDYAGNSASDSVTLNVISGGGGGGASSGAGGYSGYDNTFVEDTKDFTEVREITNTLSKKNRVRIKINNQKHYIGVKELTKTTATIEVSSTSQEVVFNIGDEKKFDVTEDGYYDLKVKLNSIESEKADITIKSIHEQVSELEAEVSLEEKVKEELKTLKESSWKIWIIIGVLIVIIVIGYFVLKKKK